MAMFAGFHRNVAAIHWLTPNGLFDPSRRSRTHVQRPEQVFPQRGDKKPTTFAERKLNLKAAS